MVLEIHFSIKALFLKKGSLFSQSEDAWHPMISQMGNSHCGVSEGQG